MYQALYRKYRPQVFSDVVGQSHVTQTLMNEIRTDRHSHAYLFTGSRGTGKTTCAKIFAKAVNCEHPVNGDPCNECETCRGIDNGSVLDVVEIDAASNNGVDSIREIRDEANFTPSRGKYRVYIIDEVHMLSTGAFNALLKTLEEPPAHVKFILATTEVHKLPATILSRCQRFDFRRITPEDIAARVAYVAEKENLNLTPGAAGLIARLADGALRDALSILDQCTSLKKDIDESVVNEVVGLAGRQHLFDLAGSIISKDASSALSQINELHSRSLDMERLCSELINHFRNLMVCRAVSDPHDLIICSDDELEEYKRMAAACSMQDVLRAINILGETLTSMRKGLNRRVEMEMAVIKLCQLSAGPEYTQAEPSYAPVRKPAPMPSVRTAPVPEPMPAKEPVPVPQEMPLTEPAPEPAPVSADAAEPQPAEEEQYTAVPEPVAADEDEFEFAPSILPESELAPKASAPAELPETEHISLQEELDDGPIPANVWNAVIRETTSRDKVLIGSMTSSKAAKRGDKLLVVTDNILLKRFILDDIHRKNISEAVYTVLGSYLTPVRVELSEYEDFVAGTAASQKAPVNLEPAAPAADEVPPEAEPYYEPEEIPAPEYETDAAEQYEEPEYPELDEKLDFQISDKELLSAINHDSAEQEPEPEPEPEPEQPSERDPLDAFLKDIQNFEINLKIEE